MTEKRSNRSIPLKTGLTRQGLKKTLLALIAVALLPAGGLAIGQAVKGFSEDRALRESALSAQFRSYVDEEESLLSSARGVLRYAASDVLSVRDDKGACNALHQRLADVDPRFHSAHFTDSSGYVVCGSGPFEEPVYVGDSPTFLERKKNPLPKVDVLFGRISKRIVAIVSEPLFEGGAFVGSTSISIPTKNIDTLTKASDEDAVARLAILPRGAWGGAPIAQDFGSSGWLPTHLPEQTGTTESPMIWTADSIDGRPYVYASASLRQQGLAAIAGWPSDGSGSNLTLRAALVVSLPVITWLLVSAVLYLALDRLVIDNIERLTWLAHRLSRGDFGARSKLPSSAPAEFADLAADLDEMANQIQARNQMLERAVQEEKLLLREVYHRVKNNLQLIVSLLNLQQREENSEQDRSVLKQAHDRVQSIALAHQSLYQVGRLSEARLDTLIEQIVSSLTAIRRNGSGPIDVRLELEPVVIDADRAVPTSLLVTEALTNAMEHCATDGEPGWIKISVRPGEDAGFELEISNSLAADGEERPRLGGASLSNRLMQGFARQMRAELTSSVEDGCFRIRLNTPGAPTSGVGGSGDAPAERASQDLVES